MDAIAHNTEQDADEHVRELAALYARLDSAPADASLIDHVACVRPLIELVVSPYIRCDAP